METEDKIYGLIVQAQEMQKFCLEFKGTAEGVIKTLPGVARDTVGDVAKEIIVEGTKKASVGLLDASSKAMVAAEELSRAHTAALIKHIFVLTCTTVLFAAGLWAWGNWAWSDVQTARAELAQLQAAVEKLESQYGKATLSMCTETNGNKRPCIRTDERAGLFGDPKKGETYRVIYGY